MKNENMEIDTVDYSYPSCGGYQGTYDPLTGIAVLTTESNCTGVITARTIRAILTHGTRTEKNVISAVEQKSQRGDVKILRKGYKVR